MESTEVLRKLNSVGKKIFIQYFDLLKSYSNRQISREKAIETLVLNKISNYSGAAIRCGNAKRIFEEKEECLALKIIKSSNRLDREIIDKAKKLLKEYCLKS